MGAAKGWIRLLLRLYPNDFRGGYGPGLVETFEEQWRSTGAPGRARLMVKTTYGLVFGAVAEWRESRGKGRVDRMRSWFTEIGLAGRRLRRAPGFTLIAVVTVAGAVGAFGSVLGVVSGVLIEQMPYEDPEDLTWIWRDYWGDFPRGWLSGVDIVRLREHDEVFAEVVGIRSGRVNLSDASNTGASDVRVLLGSPGYLRLLGVAPAMGPGFSDAVAAGEWGDVLDEVVIRASLWERAFGSDPGVIGRTVYLNGDPHRVVGVMPRWFDFRQGSSLGVPIEADAYLTNLVDIGQEDIYSGSFAGLARVRPGVGQDAVERALAEVSAELDASFQNRGLRLWAAGVRDDLVADFRRPLFAVLGAAGFLLLILGANLATLFLSRSSEQTGGAAVRAALGAGRGSLIRTAVSEPLLIAIIGVTVGGAVAAFGTSFLARSLTDTLPRASEVAFNSRILLGVVVAVAAIAALSTLGPLTQWLSVRPARALKEGGRTGRSLGSERARAALVVAQVALALSLVVSAGLLLRSVRGLMAQDPGFDVHNTLTFRVGVEGASYEEDGATHEAHESLRRAFQAFPGVQEVGYASALPLSKETNQFQASFLTGQGSSLQDNTQLVDAFTISAGYGESIGLRVMEGRLLRNGDGVDGDRWVLIDDVLARRHFPAGGAVGARAVILGSDSVRIAGVVDQPRLYSVRQDDRGQLFLPSSMRVRSTGWYALRLAEGLEPTSVMGAVRRAIADRDAGLAVSEVSSAREIVRGSLAPERLNLGLALVFALSALALSGLGLYGIVSGMVGRRRREIGLRMAMGADGRRVVRSVLLSGFRLVAAGALVGVMLSAASGRWLASLLFGVEPMDPTTLVGAGAVLIATALLAAWLPARKATRIPPAEALRAD